MALVVDVPLNTMLADLDETLRVLLKRELGRHGFDGVEIAFDAPARDWSSQLSGPTVNLFLYDLRESHEFRPADWQKDTTNGHREVRPPMIMECSYAVTAWTQAVEDEHRLLSQVLGVLFTYPPLPDAWITLPKLGLFASSDPQGRFLLHRVPPGTHQLVARTRDGAEATAEIAVPGAVLDLTVAPSKRAAKKKGG